MVGIEKNEADPKKTGLTLAKAKELLGSKAEEISEEELKEVVSAIKIFCSLSYELYREKQERLLMQEKNKIISLLESNNSNKAA